MVTANVCQECVTASPASTAWTAQKVGDLSNLRADLCHKCTHKDWQGKAHNPLVHARVKEETRLYTEEIVYLVVLEETGITKSRARQCNGENLRMRRKVEHNIDNHEKKKGFVYSGYK